MLNAQIASYILESLQPVQRFQLVALHEQMSFNRPGRQST